VEGRRKPTTQKLLEEDLSDSTVLRLLKRMGFSQKNGLWWRWSETSG
jgi:hypothetical protein